jgi:peptidoglycan hydrolase-like protein with peptidoglycan-binding domain
MKKVILEEIENMKYLLGYKRGVVISEQTTPGVEVGGITGVAGTTPPATSLIKIGVKYPSIVELQNTLNTKYQTGLTPDGKYGPKTAASILAALTKTSTNSVTPVNTQVKDNNSEVIKKTAETNATVPGTTNPPVSSETPSVAGGANYTETDINNLTNS